MKISLFGFFSCLLLMIVVLLGCKSDPRTDAIISAKNGEITSPLFTLMSEEATNIHFQNYLTESPNANVLLYEYLYNGGGVATGDFNGDGLIDIYFTSNMGENRFYLNLGDLKFKEVTAISKVTGRLGPWKTGISAVDVNGDNLLDLYLCYSGNMPPEKRKNQLFINKGNNGDNIPIFEEKAAEYGLDSPAYSNQGFFFDYDHDGDLDMLLLNHNPKSLPVLNEVMTKNLLKKDAPLEGLRLFQQENGIFNDVTTSSGINGSSLSYGLGLGISDVNNDGWEDFYVSNDYTVPDYLYLNNQDGTFTDHLQESMGHTSHFSMGNDIADINNDGWKDIVTLDMLPEDNRRQKLLLSPDNYEKFDLNLRSGFHYQYMRNMLQLNNGNGTFSEIGQLAGISNTDWSWAPLLADYDNDGWKDLFVTNGYFRDYTNLDFINYMESYVKSKGRLKKNDVLEIIKQMPSSNLTNYLFGNQGGTMFKDLTKVSGLDQPANSNGAAFADLDNDGDLDLVVNNINKPAFIYRNETQDRDKNFLQVQLRGKGKNTQGIGAKVTLYSKDGQQELEQIPTKGYLSTVSTILNFGLGKVEVVDSLEILWNLGEKETLRQVPLNQLVVLKQENAKKVIPFRPRNKPLFQSIASPIVFKNKSASVNDFKRQPLLLGQFSHSGPCMVKGDINNDGLDDFFIGGAKDQSATIFIQRLNQHFEEIKVSAFQKDSAFVDADAVLFDADGDGLPDIYVASGGYHDLAPNDRLLQDRLYLGDGKGNFTKSGKAVPSTPSSKSCVVANDVNQDGFLDLFVGGRVIPGQYPEIPRSFILINDGKGNFTDQTKTSAPELENFGMITDAESIDIDGDRIKDLVVVGEWLPISIFINGNGTLVNKTSSYFDKAYSGWWNTIEVGDINEDGVADLIAGNLGTNNQLNISETRPGEMVYGDFDENGSMDPLFTYYIQGKSYPNVTRDELLGQLPRLKSRFNSYQKYANATLQDILDREQLESAKKLRVNTMETSLFMGTKESKFRQTELPIQAQYSPINEIVVSDFNNDGKADMLLFGNNGHFKLRLGKFDANYGMLFWGNGSGEFEYVDQIESGLNIRGSVSSAILIDDLLFLGINGEAIEAYKNLAPNIN